MSDDSTPSIKINRGRGLWIPFGFVITIVVFLLVSGWKANAFLAEIQGENAATRAAVENLRADMKADSAMRWSRSDMERWSYLLERNNREIKLMVPDVR